MKRNRIQKRIIEIGTAFWRLSPLIHNKEYKVCSYYENSQERTLLKLLRLSFVPNQSVYVVTAAAFTRKIG